MAKFKHPSRGGEASASHMVNGPLADVVDTIEVDSSQAYIMHKHVVSVDVVAAICASGIITREKATPENVATRAVDYAVAITAELARRGL